MTVEPASAGQGAGYTLDLGVLGATLGYAGAVGRNFSLGGSVGLGLPILELDLGGRGDFFENALGEPKIAQFAWASLFARYAWGDELHVHVDVGPRVALFAYSRGDEGGDLSAGIFYGGYVNPMLGGQRVKLGMLFMAGVYDSSEASGGTGFGVQWVPLLVRIAV